MFVQWNQNIKSAIWSITWLIFIGSHSLGILREYKKLFKNTSLLNTSFFKETVLKQPIKAPLWVLEEKVVLKVRVFRRMCFALTYSARPYKVKQCQSERALARVLQCSLLKANPRKPSRENGKSSFGPDLIRTWAKYSGVYGTSSESSFQRAVKLLTWFFPSLCSPSRVMKWAVSGLSLFLIFH